MGSLLATFSVGQMTSSLSLSPDLQHIFIGLQNGQIQKWNLLSNPQPQVTINTDLPRKHLTFEDSTSEPMDIDLDATEIMASDQAEKKITCFCSLNTQGSQIAVGYTNGDLHILCTENEEECLQINLFPNNDKITWMKCISNPEL